MQDITAEKIVCIMRRNHPIFGIFEELILAQNLAIKIVKHLFSSLCRAIIQVSFPDQKVITEYIMFLET